MKKFIASACSALLVAAAVTLVYAPSATATTPECVPQDAWTETVEHPAEGEPTITIDNPEYEPAVEEVSHLVEHPAETKVVEHAAEYRTEYHFAKFTREHSGQKVRGEIQWGSWSAWTKWLPEQHTSWETSTTALGTPQPHAEWTEGNGQNRVYFERQWQAQHDGKTRQIKTKDAWSETVVVREAWTEKVIDVEAKPAVGEPTIVVENPDYVEARTETIEHEAVTCAVTAPAPVATQPAGQCVGEKWTVTLGGVILPWVDGGRWYEERDGAPIIIDEYDWLEPGTVRTFWFKPSDGYTLGDFAASGDGWTARVDDGQAVYTVTINDLTTKDCTTSTPTPTPDPEPTVDPEPTPTVDPTPTANPTPSDSETPTVVTPNDDGDKRLANTGGSPINPLIPIGGVIAIAAGAGVLIRSRLSAQQ